MVCCVLPELMVAPGAALASAGFAIWQGRRPPCPTDPTLAAPCVRLRRYSAALYALALIAFVTGAVFAFVLPLTGSAHRTYRSS